MTLCPDFVVGAIAGAGSTAEGSDSFIGTLASALFATAVCFGRMTIAIAMMRMANAPPKTPPTMAPIGVFDVDDDDDASVVLGLGDGDSEANAIAMLLWGIVAEPTNVPVAAARI